MKEAEQFRICRAEASHVEFLSSFGRQSFIDAYQRTLPLEELEIYTGEAFKKAIIRDEIEHARALYFICQDLRSKPCGYAKLLISRPPECIDQDGSIELQRLYVDKKYRAKGAGKALALHAENHAIKGAFRTIWLRVWDENVVAQKMYLKWQYTVQGEEKYPVGHEERGVLIMAKKLAH